MLGPSFFPLWRSDWVRCLSRYYAIVSSRRVARTRAYVCLLLSDDPQKASDSGEAARMSRA